MTLTLSSTITLNNGISMPRFGLGVWRTRAGSETEDAVGWALDAGYRLIDTAVAYGNEVEVGKSVRASSVPRQEIFVTSKIQNSDLSYDSTKAALDASISRLDIGYVDLYLIHWPVNDWQGAWHALEERCQTGDIKAIGVSNFMQHHLEELLDLGDFRPAVNQFEYHPYLQQPDLVEFCHNNGIAVIAWAPIMRGRVAGVPELVAIGEKYGKSAVQVTLRWMLQTDIITIPKSAHKHRIESNADLYDFELSDEDIQAINALDQDERLGAHPDKLGRPGYKLARFRRSILRYFKPRR